MRYCFLPVVLLSAFAASSLVAQDRTTAVDSSPRLPQVRVIESPTRGARLPGSLDLLDARSLRQARVLTTNEALRKLPGIHVRDEEGLGLRPNIGIRGLNPTRSTKVLLLEDGVPIAMAPYGDPASYYHPPIDRVAEIEVVKGASQIRFGPQTIGGVINYLTPAIPERAEASLLVAPGDERLLDAIGGLVDLVRKQGAGARSNSYSELTDATAKLELALSPTQTLSIRGNQYAERSQVTYSGLTEAEWAADPLQNPFANDRMILDRGGLVVAHRLARRRGTSSISTTAFAHRVQRDWWRQSSNSAQRPNDRSDPTCGGMANLLTTCGNEGRLRTYHVIGIEPRATAVTALGEWSVRTDVGLRAQHEQQERRQVNGQFPTARTIGATTNVNSGLVEDNRRETAAFAGFAQWELTRGRVTVVPGLRVEHVRLSRLNRRPTTQDPQGASGATALTTMIPGAGITFNAAEAVSVFAGVHRGFAPPRPEDVIDNSTGGVVDLDAELSWNSEVGARAQLGQWGSASVTAFRMAFSNQIIPASVAGGTGAALTSAGATLHQGGELSVRLAPPSTSSAALRPFIDIATTWVPVARFDAQRFAFIGVGGSDVIDRVYADQNAAGSRRRLDVSRNRLPYAPRWMHTATAGVAWGRNSDVRVEAVHISDQFGDAANTRVTVADGQQGVVGSSLVFNLASNVAISRSGTTLFVTAKNLTDRRYVVDRTRGLLPGLPRRVQIGVNQSL
jgi:Fe(3+) dicitrate transport protein